MDALAHQNIEVFAHYLYQLSGRQKGRSKDYWCDAERLLNENLFRDERPTSRYLRRKSSS
jgi:hypothetical protein